MIYVIVGVSGSGKTALGRALAERLGLPFYDADDFHPPANVAKMSGGVPLEDADRVPWLRTLAGKIREWNAAGGAVLACSALKEKYRQLLRQGGAVTFVFLEVPKELLAQRLRQRKSVDQEWSAQPASGAERELYVERSRCDGGFDHQLGCVSIQYECGQ